MKYTGIFLIFFICATLLIPTVLITSPVYAAAGETGTSAGEFGMDMLKTAGLLTASFVAPQLITNLFMGDNQMAKETGTWSVIGGSGGALFGGALFGSMGGLIGGSAGALLGGIGGAWAIAGEDLGDLERMIVARVVALNVSGGDIFDAKYKTLGSDTPSDKFDVVVKSDKEFIKKDKGVYYQFVPVVLKKEGKTQGQIESAVLVLDYNGLSEYANKYTIGTPISDAMKQQTNFGKPYSAGVPANDPLADAVWIDYTPSIGWCNLGNKGAIAKKDKEASGVIEALAKESSVDSTTSFVLLLKNIKPEEEELKIPSFNCFGPNGMKGVTGESARPKVEFNWNWLKAGPGGWYDKCSKDLNEEGVIYCDSTQFTEQILARLQNYDYLTKNIKDSALNTDEFDSNDPTKNDVYDVLHFRANLMLDGYTQDFLNDFKDYSKKAFLDFDDKTKAQIGSLLPDKIKFLPLSGELASPEGYKLPYAGTYNVNIRIIYNAGGNYDLYDDTTGILKENVKSVNVYLEPIGAAETNPVYSMPLDATVGVDAGVIHRIGYGVDYKGDAIRINYDDLIFLEPSLSSTSTPIVHLDMTVKQDTQTLNGGNLRGALLQILPKSGPAGVVFDVKKYLSMPAPVYLKVEKKTDGGAWAFYSVDVGNGPENAGSSFILWSLICPAKSDGTEDFSCESLHGAKPTDEMYRADNLGVHAKVAPVGQLQGIVYGLEWGVDSIIRDDKHTVARYQGIVYLPESTKKGRITITNASDKAYLSANLSGFEKSTDLQVDLSPLFNDTSTLENIYDLMDQNKVCMSADGAGVRFWWNPKEIFKSAK